MKGFNDRLTANVNIPFAMLIVGLSLTGLSVLVLLYVYAWRAPLDDILKVIATGVGITTVLYAALNFGRFNIAHQETVELKKLELTAKFIERWNDPKFAEVVKPVVAFLKVAPTLSPSELAKKIDEDGELRVSAMFLLNMLEALAVQIKYEALHSGMAKSFFRGIVVIYQTRLHGLIELGRTRTENPRLFIDLEDLAKLWGEK